MCVFDCLHVVLDVSWTSRGGPLRLSVQMSVVPEWIVRWTSSDLVSFSSRLQQLLRINRNISTQSSANAQLTTMLWLVVVMVRTGVYDTHVCPCVPTRVQTNKTDRRSPFGWTVQPENPTPVASESRFQASPSGGGHGGVGAGRIYCGAGGLGGALMTMVQIGARLAPKHTDSQPKKTPSPQRPQPYRAWKRPDEMN